MGLADLVRRFEQEYNRRGIVRLRKRGWKPKILPYTGYGSDSLRVLARAVMAAPDEADSARSLIPERAQRGWHQFFTTQVGYLPVTVSIGGTTIETHTDASGYIDLLVEDHGLEPGVHEALITPVAGAGARAPVVIVDPGVRTGIVSDVDDTIVVTWLPRPFLAAWNSFVRRTNARQAVPGMAEFYAALLDDPADPVFYLSTGAWNTAPTLEDFIRANGFPAGPLLLTDWGPTPTGLFRSGQEHKKTQLRNLLIAFPDIRWILVGDDGQHDPYVYADLAREHPSRVAGIVIRELDAVEQVLSHGVPIQREAPSAGRAWADVPTVRGHDGYELLARWRGEDAGKRHCGSARPVDC